ncbi:MAG: cation:proton antiporter [Candidatus Shapirobacteria bacterium]|nr:cation:proton antiporter [Candidatus Shapirobacteria bacterium]
MNQEFFLVVWLGLILTIAFLGGFLAKKAKQPTVVGYLLAGFLISLVTSKFIQAKDLISFLSEIGIALLMFTLGLELSLDYLKKVKTIAVWGGLIQILLVIIAAIFIFPRFGFDFAASLFMGCAFAMSSTAIVVKILTEKGEIDTLPGEIMLGWLLVQDLAVLPMMVILPVMLGANISFWSFSLDLLKSVAMIFGVLFIGRKLAPKFISWVADFGSRELLLLAVVALCLLMAVLTSALGLSLALGAFLAGLVISKTSENHAIFSEIRPLRDLFSIIFFVSLGMFLNPYFLISHFWLVLSVSLIVLVFKFIVVTILTLYLGYHAKTAILVGLGLIQAGEFAFILARFGLNGSLINEETYSLILSVALITILVTPWAMNAAPKFYFLLQRTTKKWPHLNQYLFAKKEHLPEKEGLDLTEHVVICGHGRVGSWLARALELLEIPYVVIDYNHQIITELKSKGVQALYGDPADIDVLDYAQVDRAKVVVVAIPDQATQEIVVTNCQNLNPNIKIISRIHQKEAFSRMKTLGVISLIQPEFEGALSIIHRVLQIFGVDKEEIAGKIKRLKIEHGTI